MSAESPLVILINATQVWTFMNFDESTTGAAETPFPEGTAEGPVERVERRRAARRLLRAEYFYALGLACFSVLALFAYSNAYFGWDLRTARAVQSLAVPGLFELMRIASVFANGPVPWLLTVATALLFLAARRRSEAAGVVLSAGGSAFINVMIKTLIGRPRPGSDLVQVLDLRRSLSFPSGHVTFYVCYFGFLFFVAYALLPREGLARRAALAASALPILLVGMSRVYLGAHWPSDTLGAYLAGGLWLAFSLHMYRRWKARATFHPTGAAVEGATPGE